MYVSEHIITKKHYLVLSVLFFALGIFLSAVFSCIKAIIIALALLPFLFIAFKFSTKQTKKAILLSLLFGIFTFFGILRLYSVTQTQNKLSNYIGKEAWLTGTVASEPRLSSNQYSYSFDFDVSYINHKIPASEKIVISIPSDYGINVGLGDHVFCWTKIELPKSDENPLTYDYFTQLKGRNIFLLGKTKNINHLDYDLNRGPLYKIKELGYFIRTKILDAINEILPDNKEYSAILKGILVGDKSGFDDELYKKFSNAGISHIVAVSGLHLSILYSFMALFLGLFSKRRRLNIVLSIPLIVLFMSASAFTPSVCRASIMLFVMFLSLLTYREYSAVTSLFISLGILIFISPYSLFSKSLVLSFSATLGIFVYFNYINQILKLPFLTFGSISGRFSKLFNRVFLSVTSCLSLSYSTFLGTSYFLVLFFGGISKVQFLTNLWVIPLASLVFCLGYISCIIFYICPFISINILRYPLCFFLNLIKKTADFFGDDRFFLETSFKDSAFSYFIVYMGFTFCVYMTLKAFHDIKIQKTLYRK